LKRFQTAESCTACKKWQSMPSVRRRVTVRKFRSVRSSIFAGLAGVEGPRVPLMLGDAPSLLEHLESNLENNQLGKRSLTIRPRVTAYYRDRFVRVPIPSLSPIIPFVYRYLWSLFLPSLPFEFFFPVFFIFYVWPRPMIYILHPQDSTNPAGSRSEQSDSPPSCRPWGVSYLPPPRLPLFRGKISYYGGNFRFLACVFASYSGSSFFVLFRHSILESSHFIL
jgi:hypothetical protein